MHIWISAEISSDAIKSFNDLRVGAENILNDFVSRSNISDIDLQIRYVPVVMPSSMAGRYPKRSKFRDKVLLSAPQIDHGAFLSDSSMKDRIRVFFSGLRGDVDLIKMASWGDFERLQLKDIIDQAEHYMLDHNYDGN